MFFLFLLVSVFADQKRVDFSKEKLIGSWSGIVNNKYGEFHFINDSLVIPISEEELSLTTEDSFYRYYISNDSILLSYRNLPLKFSFENESLILMDTAGIYIYSKIFINPEKFNNVVIDGFMLRRCVFMVNHGIITVDEAYSDLTKYINYNKMLDSIDVEEEVIYPLKRKN